MSSINKIPPLAGCDSAPPESPAEGHGGNTDRVCCYCPQKAGICQQTPGGCPPPPPPPGPTELTEPKTSDTVILYFWRQWKLSVTFEEIVTWTTNLSWNFDVLLKHSQILVKLLMFLRQHLNARSHGLVQGVVIIGGGLTYSLKLLLLKLA